MEEKIYCKEEHIPKTKTRKKFIKDFIEQQPTTYATEECDKIQCYSNRDRSVSDILAVTQSRFKKTSLKAVVRIIHELNDKGRCDMVWCSQTNKFVVRGGHGDGAVNRNQLLTSYSQKYFKDTVGVDGISYKNITDIKEEIDEEQN